MRLYHFTSPAAAPLIAVQGIMPTLIRVPRVGFSAMPVVSLTGDPDPTPLVGMSLWDDGELTGDALAGYRLDNPDGPPPLGPNTAAVRLTVEVPDDDPALYCMLYPDIAPLGFADQAHIDEFVRIGGGTVEDWRVYLGTVPAAYISAMEDLRS